VTVSKHASLEIEPSIGELVKDATTHLSTVIHGEIELAKLELKRSVRFGGTGAALFAAAGVVLVFSLTFFFVTLALILVTLHIWAWAAFGIVFLLLLLVAGAAGLIGFKQVKRVKAPERTIATTKDTVSALKRRPPSRETAV
jgi:Putative Actinobacterial Holin-X, holin superfamily III